MRGMDYLYDRGIRVPADLSVAGFDDNVLGQNLRPRLTTIHQDPSQKARLAFGMLRGSSQGNGGKGRSSACPYPW